MNSMIVAVLVETLNPPAVAVKTRRAVVHVVKKPEGIVRELLTQSAHCLPTFFRIAAGLPSLVQQIVHRADMLMQFKQRRLMK